MKSALIQKSAVVALALFAQSAFAQVTEVSRFESIHGQVIHQEGRGGYSTLQFVTKRKLVALPTTWGRVAVERVVDLNGQTAILMSHSEAACPSRMSLAVVSRDTFWGPYAVGGCEDILVHQRSSDGNDLIAIRADSTASLAWVYSVVDSQFRGPVSVSLPESMSTMVPKASEVPLVKAIPPKPAKQAATVVTRPSASTKDQGDGAMPARKTTAPVRNSLTPTEASAVATQLRKAKPVQPLSINL